MNQIPCDRVLKAFRRRSSVAAAIVSVACLLGSSLPAQVRVPGFKPSSSGLHFINYYPSIPLLTINILGAQVPIGDASNGLCGGMAYVARDYYDAGLLPPPDVTSSDGHSRPPQVLFDYLVKRLFDSFELPGGPFKYMHLMDPALPDHETDFSRAGLAPHGRAWVMIIEEWPAIKATLDLGLLAPMALVRVKSLDPFQMGHNHQVLAYGYDLSGNDLTIYVYDPNYPGRDDVYISLSLADPQHTTAVTYSMGEEMFCFFHTNYVFDAPPVTPCASGANAGIALSTGVDGSGALIANGLADSRFEVTSPAGDATCATVVPDDVYPIGPWAASTSNSKWIGLRKRSSNGAAGRYRFLARLDLPGGADTSAMGIVGNWTSDDATVDVLVNGVSTGISGSGDFTVLSPFPPLAGLGLFRPGRNTVEFLVDNGFSGSENPIGLRVEAVVTTVAQADLVVSQLLADPGTVLAGGNLTVNLTTSNIGNLASAATTTRLFLAPANGGSQIFLGDVNVPPLCAGCASSTSLVFTVPSGTPDGSYSIGGCAENTGVVSESSEGNNCNGGNAIAVQGSTPAADCHREAFNSRRVFGWVASSGQWEIVDGKLAGTGDGDEAWIWSTGVVAADAAGESYTFDFELVDAGGDPAVGRHGGVMFCSTSPTRRMDGSASGYTVDWIDRESDHGLRLLRFDHGVQTELRVGTPQLANAPANWRIILDSQRIKVFGDGVLYMDVADATYRGGQFGVWSYVGQSVRIDNLSFGNACGGRLRPFDMNQDGALQLSDCVSLLGFLYLGTPARLPCGDGTTGDPSNKVFADYNGDGKINLSDPVGALTFLFLGGAPPVAGQVCMPIEGCPDAVGGACAGR
jgi:hypothetical protein